MPLIFACKRSEKSELKQTLIGQKIAHLYATLYYAIN